VSIENPVLPAARGQARWDLGAAEGLVVVIRQLRHQLGALVV
jgi:hypothetical protein